MPSSKTSPRRGVAPTPVTVTTVPADQSTTNTASTVVEAPQTAPRSKLDPHAFPDGGGSGGAEAFSRKNVEK